MLAQSPEPEAHNKVLDNPDRIETWKCWLLRRGENRITRRKTSRSKEENQQQTQPTHDAVGGALTTAPSLPPWTCFLYICYQSVLHLSCRGWQPKDEWMIGPIIVYIYMILLLEEKLTKICSADLPKYKSWKVPPTVTSHLKLWSSLTK